MSASLSKPSGLAVVHGPNITLLYIADRDNNAVRRVLLQAAPTPLPTTGPTPAPSPVPCLSDVPQCAQYDTTSPPCFNGTTTAVCDSCESGYYLHMDLNACLTSNPLPNPGSNITQLFVSPPNNDIIATLTFDRVGSKGATTLTPLASNSSTPLPANFGLGDPAVFYDIQTTSAFDGTVRVCLSYPLGSFAAGVTPYLLHYQGEAWVDVTTDYDEAQRLVCGRVTSFSPFVLAEKLYDIYTETGGVGKRCLSFSMPCLLDVDAASLHFLPGGVLRSSQSFDTHTQTHTDTHRADRHTQTKKKQTQRLIHHTHMHFFDPPLPNR